MTFEEIAQIYGFGRSRGVRKGIKVAPKYRNPEDSSETWSGRGRRPRWLATKIGMGANLADFAI